MKKPMSDAERQRNRRARLANAHLKPLLVKGENGEFDPRIRIALAVQALAINQDIPISIIEKIAEMAEIVIPTEEFNKKYIRKIVINFLEQDE